MKIKNPLVRAGRKIIGVALCLVMIFTTFFIFDPSVLRLSAKAAVWGGDTSATSGTDYTVSGTTLHIKTPNGLAWFINNLETYKASTAYLDADFDLDNNDAFPVNSTTFTGTFDGQGHTISNFKSTCAYTDDNWGFFRYVGGATIKNVKFSNAYVGNYDGDWHDKDNDGYSYGIVVGRVSSATTVSDVTVTGSTVSGRADVGGIIGTVNGSATLTNCSVSANIKSVRQGSGLSGKLAEYQGGLVGYSDGTVSMDNCTYAGGTVNGFRYSGGLIGFCSGTLTIKNSKNYGTVSPSGDNMSDTGGFAGKVEGAVYFSNNENRGTVSNAGVTTGGFIGWISNGTNVTSISNCYNYGSVTSGGNYAGGIIGADDGSVNHTMSNCKNYGKVTAGRFAGGIIGKTVRSVYFTSCSNETGATVNTTNDGENDSCTGGIIGINENANELKFTDCVNNGTVNNTRDSGGGMIGLLRAYSSGTSFIRCVNNGTINNDTWYAGGLIGKSDNDNLVIIQDCTNTANISTTDTSMRYVAGIAGYIKGPLTMTNTKNTGNISSGQYTAGLIACIQDDGCTITNCLNEGNVSSNGSNNAAGILSTIESAVSGTTWTISNTVNSGNVSGASAIGGFIGYFDDEKDVTVNITDCVNKGSILSSGAEAGGFVGNMNNHGTHKYTRCYNYGAISSSSTDTSFLGGIVAKEYGFGQFTNCINYANVTKTSTSGDNVTGGICGWIQDDTSSFTKCINYGDIKGRNNVGGILAEVSTDAYSNSKFTFTDCGNYGNIKTTNSGVGYLGGIVGRFDGKKNNSPNLYILRCFNGNGTKGQIGESSCKGDYTGGILGSTWRNVVIADSYSNSPAVYGNTTGGIVGNNGSTVNLRNTYFKATYGATKFVGNNDDSSYTGNTNYNSSTISTGTAYVTSSTLNKTYTDAGITPVGNAYVYKQGINNNYPVLSWQVNTLSMNLGRNLIADLVSSSGSGFTGNNSTYDVKVDGVTKTYHMAYTKTVNGVSVTYYTFSDTFVLDGTPSATGTFDILNVKNTEGQKTVNLSAYYVGGNAVNSSVSVYSNTISRTGVHKTTSVSASEAVKVTMTVDSSVEDFDNYSFHASMDYSTNVSNISSTADALIDLHSKYAGLATPTKTGYNFLGWFNQRTGGSQISNGTAVNSGNPSFNDTLDRDYDIYARWNPITYTIEYDGNGETSGTTESSTHTYDEAKNLTANGFKREFTVTFDYNYEGSTATTETAKSEFVNWLCSKDGITYDDCASVLNLTTTDKETITMTAQWTDKTVEFPTPTREGYDFLGWFNDDEQEVDESTVISENMTLHAEWQIKTYRVIFMNGDTVCQSSVWEYNTMPQYTSATPTKDSDDDYEYTFSGWLQEIVPVTCDATYTAQFTEKAHEFERKQLDSEYHQFVCKNCGYEKAKEKHTFEYVKNGTGHIYKCKDCGYSYSEDVAEYTVEFTGDIGEVISKTIRSDLSTDYYIVTIQAPLKNGDKYFVYWIDSDTGEKVSTYRTYSFFQTGDRSFEPVYTELTKYTEERNSAVFSSTVTGVRSRQSNNWSLYAEHSVAKTIDGFPKYNASNKAESIKNIISRYGVIYTAASEYMSNTAADMESVLVMGGGEDVTDKAAGMTDLTRDLTGVLEVNVETDSDAIWARTYVVDANGNVHYGTPKKITLSADTASVKTETVTTSSISLDTTDLNIETDAPNPGSETTETETTEKSFFDKLVSFLKAVWRWILESSICYF